jgi:hypothetical protein
MGATRQAQSHCKAAIGVGNSIAIVEEVVKVATKVAEWNEAPLPGNLNVQELAAEIKSNLNKM